MTKNNIIYRIIFWLGFVYAQSENLVISDIDIRGNVAVNDSEIFFLVRQVRKKKNIFFSSNFCSKCTLVDTSISGVEVELKKIYISGGDGCVNLVLHLT